VETDFWIARWAEGKIGFHEGKPNAYLERNRARLAGRRRVLVPLCGKSIDLAYLAGFGHQVVGVELVEEAAQQFFSEQGVTAVVRPHGAFREYVAGAITIYVGDWFAVDQALLGAFDAFYDRAALIAMPPEMRPAYAKQLRALAGTAPGLLVTLEYDQAVMDGPPFSVREDEVRRLFDRATVEVLDEGPGQVPRLPPDAECTTRCYFVRYAP
jgi:thiopurine S-methyltransferase